jgi:soluble lytic murein transglycosylase-like protein
MSVAEVHSRISDIRAQFGFRVVGASGGPEFAQALGAVQPAAAHSPDVPATSGTSAAAGTSGPSLRAAGAGSLPVGTPYANLFQKAEAKYGVDAELLASVAKHESSFNPRAVSPAGAQGLMQLMPATARGLSVADPFDPSQAVDGAARLLRDLLREFGRTDLALAAYNAGPGAVHKYNGIPPYRETQNYVRSIMSDVGTS